MKPITFVSDDASPTASEAPGDAHTPLSQKPISFSPPQILTAAGTAINTTAPARSIDENTSKGRKHRPITPLKFLIQ